MLVPVFVHLMAEAGPARGSARMKTERNTGKNATL